MILLFYLDHKRLTDEIQFAIGNDILFLLEYTYERFSRRRIDEILKFFREEIRLAEDYDFQYDLNN